MGMHFIPVICAAGFAESMCYPVDSVKTWLQVTKKPAPPTMFQMPSYIRHIAKSGLKKGGLASTFRGLPLAIGRNAISTGIVFGLNNHSVVLASQKKLLASGMGQVGTKVVCVGGLSCVANAFLIPLEVLKTRIQADGMRHPHLRRYTGCIDAFLTFTRKNGVSALWNGGSSTLGRSAIWWASSIPVYSETKQLLLSLGMKDSSPAHIMSSAVSGLCGTVASQPFDTLKTKLQNQSAESPKYRGTWHCFRHTLAKEGPSGLSKGFLPRYCRLGPWQLVFFVAYEKLLWVLGEDQVK